MRKNFNLLLCMALLMSLSFCDSKKDEIEGPVTQEENKEKLQAIGIEFLDGMAGLADAKVFTAMNSFSSFVELSLEGESAGRVDKAVTTLNSINQRAIELVTSEISASAFTTQVAFEEEPESLQELFDQYKGVYAWNATTFSWDYTEGGDVIEFTFPCEEDGSTNNSSLTLREYQGVTVPSHPFDSIYNGDLPASLKIDLYVDDVKEMDYSLSIAYGSTGMPSQVDVRYLVSTYSYETTLTYNEQQFKTNYKVKNGEKLLLQVSSETNGSLSVSDFIDAEGPHDVITNSSASVTLLDLNISASLDVQNMGPKLEDLDMYGDKEEDGATLSDMEAAGKTLVDAMNAHTTFSATYTDTGSKVADPEWYYLVEEDDHSVWVDLRARLVFGDGSKADLEEFFGTGFEELEKKIEEVFDIDVE